MQIQVKISCINVFFYLAQMNSISAASDTSQQQGLSFEICFLDKQNFKWFFNSISESNYAAIDLPGAPLSLNVDNYQPINMPASSPNTDNYQPINLPASSSNTDDYQPLNLRGDNQQHESNCGPLPESSDAKVVMNIFFI